MPDDTEITDEEGSTFADIIEHFESNPDRRCIPLLVGAVSENTGLGMYEHIQFALLAHAKADVIPHLREGLRHGNNGTKYRCCWWAIDLDAWELEDLIIPLADHSNEDIRDAARAFIESRGELA